MAFYVTYIKNVVITSSKSLLKRCTGIIRATIIKYTLYMLTLHIYKSYIYVKLLELVLCYLQWTNRFRGHLYYEYTVYKYTRGENRTQTVHCLCSKYIEKAANYIRHVYDIN